jgi:hypothetical protein
MVATKAAELRGLRPWLEVGAFSPFPQSCVIEHMPPERAFGAESGSDSEALKKHKTQVRFVASRRFRFGRSAEESSSGQYRIDGLYKMTDGLRFQDVTLRSGLTNFGSQPLGIMGGKYQHRDSKALLSHSGGGLKSTHAWHRNVENHEVWV